MAPSCKQPLTVYRSTLITGKEGTYVMPFGAWRVLGHPLNDGVNIDTGRGGNLRRGRYLCDTLPSGARRV